MNKETHTETPRLGWELLRQEGYHGTKQHYYLVCRDHEDGPFFLSGFVLEDGKARPRHYDEPVDSISEAIDLCEEYATNQLLDKAKELEQIAKAPIDDEIIRQRINEQ